MPELIEKILGQELIEGWKLSNLVYIFLVIFATFVCIKVVSHILSVRLRRLADRTKTVADELLIDALSKPLQALIFLGGLFITGAFLPLSEKLETIYYTALRTAVAIILTWALLRATDVLTMILQRVALKTGSKLDDQLIPILRKTLRVVIVIVAFLLILQSLRYPITSLLAGLGIGGLAVALAAQDTLSNIFGSIMLLIDRPFVVGDWVIAGEIEGVVEEIGLRSTRIRTFPRSLVTIPNSELAKRAINNFSQMPKRRVLCTVGVTYETTAEEMEQAVAAIRQIVVDHPETDNDFIVVNFNEFGDSSLNIHVYFFTTCTDYANYMRVRQEINLAIMRALKQLGLEIAFPTRTLYMRAEDKSTSLPPPKREQSSTQEKDVSA